MKRSFIAPLSFSAVLLASVLPGVHGQMFRGDNGRRPEIEIGKRFQVEASPKEREN